MWYSSITTKVVRKEGTFRQFIGPNADIRVEPGIYSVKWPDGTEELHRIILEDNEDSSDFMRLYFNVTIFGATIPIWLGDGHDIMLSEKQED